MPADSASSAPIQFQSEDGSRATPVDRPGQLLDTRPAARLGPRREELVSELAAAAVEAHTAQKTPSTCDLKSDRAGSRRSAYSYGADRVDVVSAESRPGCSTILGWVIWVDWRPLGPVEATFELDEANGVVRTFTVRTGDARVLERDSLNLRQ
jgi:hypothetical protein